MPMATAVQNGQHVKAERPPPNAINMNPYFFCLSLASRGPGFAA